MKVFRQGGVLKGDLVCLRFWVVRIPSFNIFPERSFQIAPRRQPPRFLTLAFAKLSCSTRALGSLIPWFLWSLLTSAIRCSPAKVEQACSTLPHTQAHWVSSFPFCTTLEHAGRAHPGQHHAVCYLLLCLKKPTRCIGIGCQLHAILWHFCHALWHQTTMAPTGLPYTLQHCLAVRVCLRRIYPLWERDLCSRFCPSTLCTNCLPKCWFRTGALHPAILKKDKSRIPMSHF